MRPHLAAALVATSAPRNLRRNFISSIGGCAAAALVAASAHMNAVVAYDPEWVSAFAKIKERLLPAVRDLIIGIEHVGSTSVPGLAAKPTIDIDIIYRDHLPEIIRQLETLGYKYEGDKGIQGREFFRAPAGTQSHNLYACLEGCLALRNHLILRDHLLTHPADRAEYSQLKLKLGPIWETDPESYIEGKTAFILKILSRYGVSKESLSEIEEANRKKATSNTAGST